MFRTRILMGVVLLVPCLCLTDVQADMFDLTGSGSGSVTINGARFYNSNFGASGTGTLDPFVRINSNNAIEQGYNTSYRPVQYDENGAANFTRDLLLSTVPQVDIGGTLYREFLLDINQSVSASGRLLSLDGLEIYQADTGGRTGHPTGLGTLAYSIDSAADHSILLDATVSSSGSGKIDMYAYVPVVEFSYGGDYVYLYSKFGVANANTGGFEEWAVRTGWTDPDDPPPPPPPPPPPVPNPAAILLGLLGLSTAGWKMRRFA